MDNEIRNDPETQSPDYEFEVIWGAEAIGRAIACPPRQAFYLLETGRLPGARKIGSKWCISRRLLRQIFEDAA